MAPALRQAAAIENLQPIDELNVPREHYPRAFLLKPDSVRLDGFRLEDNFLQVEDNVRHIFDDVWDCRELMQGTFDANRGDGGSLERSKQHAA